MSQQMLNLARMDIRRPCVRYLSVMSWMALIGAIGGCKEQPLAKSLHTTSAMSQDHWMIQWAEAQDGSLLFISFNDIADKTQPPLSIIVGADASNRNKVSMALMTPTGQVLIPSSQESSNVFERQNGVYRDVYLDIDMSTFQAFLESKPAAYSIEELQRFCALRPLSTNTSQRISP